MPSGPAASTENARVIISWRGTSIRPPVAARPRSGTDQRGTSAVE